MKLDLGRAKGCCHTTIYSSQKIMRRQKSAYLSHFKHVVSVSILALMILAKTGKIPEKYRDEGLSRDGM